MKTLQKVNATHFRFEDSVNCLELPKHQMLSFLVANDILNIALAAKILHTIETEDTLEIIPSNLKVVDFSNKPIQADKSQSYINNVVFLFPRKAS